MDVREIITKHLKENNYDGLVGDGCSCVTEDLFCCDGDIGCIADCQVGKIKNCNECDEQDKELKQCVNGWDYCITANIERNDNGISESNSQEQQN